MIKWNVKESNKITIAHKELLVDELNDILDHFDIDNAQVVCDIYYAHIQCTIAIDDKHKHSFIVNLVDYWQSATGDLYLYIRSENYEILRLNVELMKAHKKLKQVMNIITRIDD